MGSPILAHSECSISQQLRMIVTTLPGTCEEFSKPIPDPLCGVCSASR